MLEWVTRPTLTELTGEFCRRLDALTGAIEGDCAVALTGGESAAVFYDAWAAHGVGARLQFYWSDERVVAPTDPDSNYKLASDHLLDPAEVAENRIHRAPTELGPGACATAYAAEIRRRVAGRAGAAATPQFPLIILGLGADGHTGSLFPGRDPYNEDSLLVRAVEESSAHPHPRVTFTPQLINAAVQVWFVITGAKKAWAVEQLAERRATPEHVPALIADPARTHVTLFADTSSTGGRTF
ncbi:MAG: 6-phosphogluconolactonase [Terriglobales bacterium]